MRVGEMSPTATPHGRHQVWRSPWSASSAQNGGERLVPTGRWREEREPRRRRPARPRRRGDTGRGLPAASARRRPPPPRGRRARRRRGRARRGGTRRDAESQRLARSPRARHRRAPAVVAATGSASAWSTSGIISSGPGTSVQTSRRAGRRGSPVRPGRHRATGTAAAARRARERRAEERPGDGSPASAPAAGPRTRRGRPRRGRPGC